MISVGTVSKDSVFIRIVELLNANEQLQREDICRLLVLNEATGEKTEFPLQVG